MFQARWHTLVYTVIRWYTLSYAGMLKNVGRMSQYGLYAKDTLDIR